MRPCPYSRLSYSRTSGYDLAHEAHVGLSLLLQCPEMADTVEKVAGWLMQRRPTRASRVNVITDAASGRIVGYVTLSAAQIERAFLPRPQQRNRPDPVPVTLLGQLAVDKDYQGQGHAGSLLLFALMTALTAAESIGSVGVVTHPLDDNVRRFYARWGFQDLPFDPRRAMVVRMVDIQQSFASEIEPRGVRSPVRDVEL
jgi:GNAT superfamily N-acetyltransferase